MKLHFNQWLLLQSGEGSHSENMALDEALLEAAPGIAHPVLRFYGWTEAAASFGYFQHYSEVARLTLLRPLVRRPTGGGLVPHNADWTYTLVFPPSHDWYVLTSVASYERVHRWIQASFARSGIVTELSPGREVEGRESKVERPPPPRTFQCFIGAEQHDLLWRGRKIAGAAQRRTRSGLLIQGSIQPPPDVAKANWQKAFCDAAHFDWGVAWSAFELPAAISERARELMQEKYSQRAYNERR